MQDLRFWGTRDRHLFESVIKEVFSRSFTYCNLYVPRLDHTLSNYDPLYGEVQVGGLVYYRAKVKCMTQVVQNDYEVSERGTVLLFPAIEFTFYVPDLLTVFTRVGLSIEDSEINMIGVIIEFGGVYYEVIQDIEDVYIFNERQPEFVKVTVQATSAIDTKSKLKPAKIIDITI